MTSREVFEDLKWVKNGKLELKFRNDWKIIKCCEQFGTWTSTKSLQRCKFKNVIWLKTATELTLRGDYCCQQLNNELWTTECFANYLPCMYVCMYIYLQCFYTDGWRMKEKPWSVKKTAHADACAQDRRGSLWINCCIFHNHSQLTHQREASGQHVRHDHQNTKRGNILCKNGAHTSSRVLGCWSRMFQKVARVLALVYCKMKEECGKRLHDFCL